MAVRAPMGATNRRLMVDVLGQAARLVPVGIIAGIALTPTLIGFTALTVLLAALAATSWPARRAAAVDPSRVLRSS